MDSQSVRIHEDASLPACDARYAGQESENHRDVRCLPAAEASNGHELAVHCLDADVVEVRE